MTDADSSDPRAPGRHCARRLAAGVVLVLLAIVVFAGSRLAAHGQRHAYDPGSVPPASYHLTAGRVYQLSSHHSVAELTAAGLIGQSATPSCVVSPVSSPETQQPLTLLSTREEERVLHLFATFAVSSTGRFSVSCPAIAQLFGDDVFVDDADDAPADLAAVLMVVATVLGFVGVCAAVSGGYRLTGADSQASEQAAVDVTEGSVEPA
jgi:hypothetical protein